MSAGQLKSLVAAAWALVALQAMQMPGCALVDNGAEARVAAAAAREVAAEVRALRIALQARDAVEVVGSVKISGWPGWLEDPLRVRESR